MFIRFRLVVFKTKFCS